jgi:ribosomal protein S18 acetylase RimI-like enzyme
MEPVHTFKNFTIYLLSPNLLKKYADEITFAMDQIPSGNPHTLDVLLAETKGSRILHKKWQHSLIALDEHQQFAGIIIGYEREKEANEYYPFNTLYLNSLAVSPTVQKQGLGRFLVQFWLEYNRKLGFIDLDGELHFATQTTAADWNHHVQTLYESFGFKKIATKQYENRTDNVYLLE